MDNLPCDIRAVTCHKETATTTDSTTCSTTCSTTFSTTCSTLVACASVLLWICVNSMEYMYIYLYIYVYIYVLIYLYTHVCSDTGLIGFVQRKERHPDFWQLFWLRNCYGSPLQLVKSKRLGKWSSKIGLIPHKNQNIPWKLMVGRWNVPQKNGTRYLFRDMLIFPEGG